MTITRLERKGRRNKTRSRVKKQVRKLANSVETIASPYKDVSGIIIDENAAAVVVEVEQEVSAEAQAAADAVTLENEGGAPAEENNEEEKAAE